MAVGKCAISDDPPWRSSCFPPPRDLANIWLKCVVCDEDMPDWARPICEACRAAIRAFRAIAVEEK